MTLREKTAYINSMLPNVALKKRQVKAIFKARGVDYRKSDQVRLKPDEMEGLFPEMFSPKSKFVEVSVPEPQEEYESDDSYYDEGPESDTFHVGIEVIHKSK